ncbi:MAG: hypothetical protein IKK59_06195 [Lachnospiraceae bacterium]|nr:hypothetical protein [Lachnospiraceae bacterium]
MTARKQYIHFSFDDVYECLKDITEQAGVYRSIFENDFFAWLKRMHETYGVVFSLYTFNYFSKDPNYDISNLPNNYADELATNSDWLKFGFHSKDDLKKYTEDEPENIKADYQKFLDAIMHATNQNEHSIDRVVRLGFCAGSRENILALRDLKNGIRGLLAADDGRLLYYFGEDETKSLIEHGELRNEEIIYLRSQTRIEYLNSIEEILKSVCSYTDPKVIELFSHEIFWNLNSKMEGYSIRQICEYIIKWASENNYSFGFAQDLY